MSCTEIEGEIETMAKQEMKGRKNLNSNSTDELIDGKSDHYCKSLYRPKSLPNPNKVLNSLAWLIGTNAGKFWSIRTTFKEPLIRYVVAGGLESVLHA